MSIVRDLDNLNKKELSKVCVSTIYCLTGYFSNRPGSEVITKETFEKLVKYSISQTNRKGEKNEKHTRRFK